MDKTAAIQFLKKQLLELSYLATLPYDNSEYLVWLETTTNIIEEVFGSDSTEYKTMAVRQPFKNLFTGPRQAEYKQILRRREMHILSIIKTYETPAITPKAGLNSDYLKQDNSGTPKAFISHGKESLALTKVEKFLRELGIEPLIVRDKAPLDRVIDEKVEYYLGQADFVIILATGDDEIKGKLYPGQNVIHETGLAQKTHAGKIIYLLENNAEFPSNIKPMMWESFKQENMEQAFMRIIIELRALGMLKVIK